MSPSSSSTGSAHVTAVLVAHDGERWLPLLLQALTEGSRAPDALIAVDTGSSDATADLLAAAGDLVRVDTDPGTGFGDAVRAGLEAADQAHLGPPGEDAWVWLLHDDCAPAPEALEELLRAGEAPDVAAVGAKIRGWPRGRRLLEVGVTMTRTGHRETGLEPAEQDQGQHDDVRQVLAVSSAGMLVRRRVWDELDGFDPRLPLFRDDVDFGWRVARHGFRVVVAPQAVVFHAEAATRGVRALACTTSPSPYRADREAALYTLLVNSPALTLPWRYLCLFVVAVLRSLGYLLAKLPRAAYDEVRALAAISGHPLRIVHGRRERRQRAGSRAEGGGVLLAPWYTPFLNGVELAMAAASGLRRSASTLRGTDGGMSASARRLHAGRAAAEDSDIAPEEELLAAGSGSGPLGWLRRHPGTGLVALLALCSVVGSRGLWGGGMLQGGALLAPPDSAAAWWGRYTESSHLVGLGSELVTSPSVAVLALAGSVLAGKAWLVVDLLVLCAPALAAMGAWLVARRLVRSVVVQLWAVATYALVPVLSGATTSGHLGTIAGLVVLPWLVRSAVALFDGAHGPSWRAVFATALSLGVLVSFVPVAWPMAAALLVLSLPVLLVRGQVTTAWRAALAVALPVLLLGPWAWRLLASPELLLSDAGVVDPATGSVADVAWQLPFGRLDAAGAAPWWLSAGVVVAAVAALLRRERRVAVCAAWLVLAVALCTTWVLAYRSVELPAGSGPGFVWVGFPVGMAQGAAVAAAALACDGLADVLRRSSSGLRAAAAVLACAAVVTPLAGLGWQVWRAPHGELERTSETALPVYMADRVSSTRSRALVVTGTPERAAYQVIAGNGLRLGDDSVLPTEEATAMTRLVTSALSSGDPSDGRRLAATGVRYVVLPTPADGRFVAALDGLPGVGRASTDVTKLVGWEVSTGLQSEGTAPVAATAGAGVPALLSQHRSWWLGAQLLLCLVALVFAAPPLIARDESGEGQP